MARKSSRPTKSRPRTIECLEDRRVMAADPLAQLLGGSIQQQSLIAAPELVPHKVSGPDFWIDPVAERDLDLLTGQLDQLITNADALTGLSYVRNNYDFTGAAQTVAVIDSGIAWDHVALGGGLGASYRVVGGWDFTENDANPYDDGIYGSHGTHVSGIVGGERPGISSDGVAPGVDFVGLRVFNDAGQGYFSWVESALQWVHQNRNSFENPITTVNLSLGTSWNASTVPSWTTLEDEFAQLKADGIFISVSAGNSFTTYNTPGLSYPAASPHVVPVMAVDDNGSLSYFSQRHARAIAAPGRGIISSIPDYAGNHNGITDDYGSMSGTSMAAPYIAGASVLVREAMQFVGYANITQDTIYNHMMATATSFFDAATNQSYKRINLASAIDTLMSADDFGSTVATAHDLGELDGTSQVQGRIGTTTDADYFRFTAAGAGTVSFTVTTHGTLDHVWDAAGGAVSGASGETYTFNVVAGQTYTIGISSSAGVGNYELAVDADVQFVFTDWGTVTQLQYNNVSNTGTNWYHIRANQTGYLTAEALFAAAGGNIDISLHNASRQLLASGTASSTGERAEVLVTAGTEYFFRVVGTNADVDFRVTNLVSKVGMTVSVSGTSAADVFAFAVGTTHNAISINGTTYQFAKTAATSFSFNGGAGADAITLTGTTRAESAELRVGNASFTGAGFAVAAIGIENVAVNSGGGKDTVKLYDSAGNDLLQSYSDHTTMTGSGFSYAANGFKNVAAFASAGTDTAHLYDTVRNDTFRAYADHVQMKGSGYANAATGFDITHGHASTGTDKAYFYDSAGNDVFDAYADHATMTGPGYSNTASGFDKTCAYASLGLDVAHLYESAGTDLFRSYSNRATMSGLGYSNAAYYFDSMIGHATVGTDIARMSDSVGDEEFYTVASQARMLNATSSSTTSRVARTIAHTTSGVDRAFVAEAAPPATTDSGHWDEYQATVTERKEMFGSDDVVLESLVAEDADATLDTLDELFAVLNELG
jgi:subtilisin family serine protease